MILKININMTDITEKTENGELVTNRDQLVVVDNIESLIKVIRGQQVMLDKDLATLYGVETKRLNEQVKRNIKRFPEDFMFQLTKEECLRSQIATLNEGRGQHLKYMPYVFTENGVAMLSSVLRSQTAIERIREEKDIGKSLSISQALPKPEELFCTFTSQTEACDCKGIGYRI